jgi:hypothetical protein
VFGDILDVIGLDWSKMTLNYHIIMERYPKPNIVVGSSDPHCEINSLHDEKLARWSNTSYAPKTKQINKWSKS